MKTPLLAPDYTAAPDRLTQDFKRVTEAISALAAREGVLIKPYTAPHLPYFQKITQEQRLEATAILKNYLEVCASTIADGNSLRDTLALTWKLLRHMNYVPRSDVFDKLTNDDLLELYNDKHRLLFANMRFFEVVRYSLEDLYCRPWMELWERDQQIDDAIFRICDGIVKGEINETVYPNIRTYLVTDKESGHRGLIRPRLFSPVSYRRQPAGFLDINEYLPIEN